MMRMVGGVSSPAFLYNLKKKRFFSRFFLRWFYLLPLLSSCNTCVIVALKLLIDQTEKARKICMQYAPSSLDSFLYLRECVWEKCGGGSGGGGVWCKRCKTTTLWQCTPFPLKTCRFLLQNRWKKIGRMLEWEMRKGSEDMLLLLLSSLSVKRRYVSEPSKKKCVEEEERIKATQVYDGREHRNNLNMTNTTRQVAFVDLPISAHAWDYILLWWHSTLLSFVGEHSTSFFGKWLACIPSSVRN